MFVDRFMNTAMHYPCNYGYVPHTLSADGDPVDVLVLSPVPLISGSVVRCRPVGVLKMTDESGDDAKVLAVPIDKLCKVYRAVQDLRDLPGMVLEQIAHFFEHYKDLDEGKWVRVEGWGGIDEAKQEILRSVAMFREAPERPRF
jgi:inorganic pyrophosphatase